MNQRLHSPYDPDARYAKKRDTSWIGYKVHVTETCEADRPNLITDVHAAGTPDGAVTAPVQSALAGRGLLPETHVVDAGYVDAALLVASQVDHAIDRLGPVALDHGWRAHSEQGFDLSAFTIVWPDRVAHCPAGQTMVGNLRQAGHSPGPHHFCSDDLRRLPEPALVHAVTSRQAQPPPQPGCPPPT